MNPEHASEPFTKTELLRELRTLEQFLHSDAVVEQVRQLDTEERRKFVSARLHLTATISHLNTAFMQDIREQLERHSDELRAGIEELRGSLEGLEGAVEWTRTLNGVLNVMGNVISLL